MFHRRKSVSEEKKRQIMKRDISGKRKVTRKVQELNQDGKVQLTCDWTVTLPSGGCKISFSRDNKGVYIDDKPVESESYISDKGYDLDLFFCIGNRQCHIYSDVEGKEMMNYLLIDGDIIGHNYQKEPLPSEGCNVK